MADTKVLEDEYGAGSYDPGLYVPARIVDYVNGFDGVTDAHIAQFHEQGFLAIQNAYSARQVADAMAAVADLIAGRNAEFNGVQFEKGIQDQMVQAEGNQKEVLVRKLTKFVGFDSRLDVFGDHAVLLGILDRIMGEPPRLFANQAMLKPPGIGREKPWHQDHAYFNLPLDTCIVSAWVALDEATLENGCMRVIPGSHLDGPVVHFKRRDWQICDVDVIRNRIEAVPLKPGGVLLWHGRLHHGTPSNRSDKRRRALQLHYVPASVDLISAEDRLAVFGSEGKNVTC
jgi:phytanoyl-CoA hydroxylase